MNASSCSNLPCTRLLYRFLVCALLLAGGPVTWAQTDIATAPLFTTPANSVKPNLLFVLDDSGSMGWNYMPDEVNDDLRSDAYGRYSYQCNGVQYDPSYTYSPPVKADGTSYPNASFTAARSDGYDSASSTTDLGSRYYYKYTGSQPKMGWKFTATGSVKTTTFYLECNSAVGSTPGSSVFTKVTMTSSSTDAQNYANWYSYYRTRMLMMKTAVGMAFKDLDDKYRIGFTTIHKSLPPLDVADFNATQKGKFYDELYKANPGSSTPLRGALSRAGQYYAMKAPSQSTDPVQYSCQKNYTLLSTDGYWNTGSEVTGSGASSNFSAYKLNNTTSVGQQDGGGTPRPYFDGEQVTVTEKYTWKRVDSTPTTTVTQRRVTSTSTEKTTTTTPVSAWTRNVYSTTTSGCGSSRRRLVTQPQSGITYDNVSTSQTTTTYNDYVDTRVVTDNTTTTFVQTITKLNGAVASDDTTSTTQAYTPTSTTTNNTTGPTTTTTVGSPTTTSNQTTTWTNGTATQGSCLSSVTVPSPNPSTPVAATLTSTTPVVSTSTSTTGPTTTSSATTTTGATTQGTPTAKTTVTGYPQTTTTGGSSNSLADVAFYYYATDLRDAALSNCTGALGTSVCSNNVAAAGDDNASWQHMTTFTLGLGAGSSLTYTFDYQTRKSGDYYEIAQGTKNWPIAAANTPTAIDDLWHAAVNGRGRFFSVQNAKELATSLETTLDKIRATTGSASAAATSTLQPVQGDNDVFVAQFTTVTWVGEIKKSTIDPSTGQTAPVANWSVQTALQNKLPSDRKIYYKRASSNQLVAFTEANLSADSYTTHFSGFCSKVGASGSSNPAQCASLASADQASANTAANLVAYLRGDQTATYYRAREKILGDIVNASPVFVGKPSFNYADSGYAAFKTANNARQGVVYAGANDGMLHAFRRDTGEELWAYVPTPMLPKLYKLADTSYPDYHDYFVDGTPATADVYINGQWRTILVGGYRAGGRGYYALDITDPQNPASLWEFGADDDADLGLSFGNPIITKRSDGVWGVVFTSGHNNTIKNANGIFGDGNGHLFVLRADNGQVLKKVSTFIDTTDTAVGTTPAGTVTSPSGLTMINAWIEDDTSNVARRFYGVDLKGNVWRFDIDSVIKPYGAAFLLAQMRDASSTPQPLTTFPILGEVLHQGTYYPVIFVATGKYLGSSDLSTTQQQSSYAFVDPLTGAGYGDIRAANVLVNKSANTGTVDWLTKKGWFYDYPATGERTNVDPSITGGIITVATNVPSSDVCALGGSSFIYDFDLLSGNFKVHNMGSTLTVGITVVQLAKDGANSGSLITISTNSKGDLTTTDTSSYSGSTGLRRTSWRELD